MRKLIFLTGFALFCIVTITAQTFNLSSEIRPRYENKHGYKSLLNTGVNGANFISQRTRINFKFQQDKLKIGVSLQNVRVWGDVSTLASKDNANAFHEAWAEVSLADNFKLKLGRQEIIYDDSRIFGNVGWAQQARSHDAAIAKVKTSKNSVLDLGFALNSDSRAGADILYSNVAGYKTFQYAWYHVKATTFSLSLLALNTGVEFLVNPNEQKVNYSQTIGGRGTYKLDNFNFDGSIYLQGGKLQANKIAATYFGGNIKFKASNKFVVGLGGEYLSGKDTNDTSTKIKSFNPIFGTNHKFNGWMDYFYVGNHGNSVGLVDLYATFMYKKDKFSAKLIPHIFSSAADIYKGGTKMSTSLGTEIDLTIGYKIANNITFSAGYSKMFATDSLEFLKGGDKNENNSWGWMMFTFKPTLFTSK